MINSKSMYDGDASALGHFVSFTMGGGVLASRFADVTLDGEDDGL